MKLYHSIQFMWYSSLRLFFNCIFLSTLKFDTCFQKRTHVFRCSYLSTLFLLFLFWGRTLGYLRWFLPQYSSFVSWWKLTKWINSDNNLFLYKHYINCSLHWFIMISTYDYFSRSYIYPWMDIVNPQYIYMSSLLKRTISGKSTYLIAKLQESTLGSG